MPGGRALQSNLNFEVKHGQLFLIRGANGSGKSTLLKVLLKEWRLDNGALHISPEPEQIHYIPQLENTEVHLPLTLKDVLRFSLPHFDPESLQPLGLLAQDQLAHGWNSASGGERKRVLLLRALLSKPQLLILDEPMNHLDKFSRAAMIRAMHDFLRDANHRCIVMVCHQGLSSEEQQKFDLTELNLEGGQEEV